MRQKLVRYTFYSTIAALLLIQFIQPDRTNPPVNPSATFEVVARPEVSAIVKRSCGDCHSNDTVWPWYSRVAPVSWLVADDVKEGRAHLNFSEWSNYGPEMAMAKLKQACTEVREGGMPLWQYRLMHRDAQLTPADVAAICSAAESISMVR